mgnify:FL=1
MLAVAGLTFAYTSCTDYSEDIDANKGRIDNLGNKLATVEQQIASLKTDVTSLQAAKAEAEKAISALQTSLKSLQGKHEKDVEDVTKLINALQTKVTALETEVGKINETIKTLATKEYVDATFATKNALVAAEEKIGGLRTGLTAAEGRIKALEDKYDSELKISEILAKIDAAKKAADVADSLARKSLGDVAALKTALGVYADKGALETKIALLDKADSTLNADKLDISAFDGKFDTALKRTLETEGNVVSEEIAKQISTAKTELENSINALRQYVDGKFDYLYSVAKRLKSLVFVPDLYVDGIEATEYTYGDYTKKTAKDGVKTKWFDDKGVESWILAVDAKKSKWWNYATATGTTARQFINIPHVITYRLNPSNADVTATTPIAFVSYDKEVITKADAVPVEAEFVSAEEGDLKVKMNPVGQKVKGKGWATIFALQATYKQEGQDTTVTSDFANLYASTLTFQNLAFKKVNYKGSACSVSDPTLFKHLYTTAKAAIENEPSVIVRYDDPKGLDLKEVVTSHIKIDSKSSNKATHADYAAKFPENDYGIDYRFELIDYTSGTYATSESQHAFLKDGHIFVPCASVDGMADQTQTGAAAVTAVGRRPLVRVTLQKGNDIILVGFIKFEITKYTDYVTVKPFTDWTYKFLCAGDVNTTTWNQMVDNVIKHSGLTKEEFCKVYALETIAGTVSTPAVQYKLDGGKFVKASSAEYLGTVTEKKDAVPGTTTDVIEWKLEEKDLSAIYKLSGHTKTIWVRYVYSGVTPTSEYEGIYVPLTVKNVVKPVASVSKKLMNYWFKGEENAKINVQPPVAMGSTIPWDTDINQVWEGNKPVFTLTPATGFDAATAGGYKYYFAPVQKTYTINGVKYKLFVKETKVYDKYVAATVINVTDNAKIKEFELNNAITINLGIYTNDVLYCKKDSDATEYEVAKLDQINGVVSYQDNDVAKELLNAYESVPSDYEAAQLFANIGVTAYSPCNTALSLSGAVNPYYFLRPINAKGVDGKFFIDGKDLHVDESNINLFELFDFTDWRGEKFVKAPGDYTNLWYFKYYNVKNIKVDLDNVTTDLDGGTLGTTKLSDKTTGIHLEYWFGPRTSPTAQYTTTAAANIPVNIVASAEPNWGISHYNGLIDKFGYIHYHNNLSTVSKDFTICVPVSFTYDWGVVNTHVDILVKAL